MGVLNTMTRGLGQIMTQVGEVAPAALAGVQAERQTQSLVHTLCDLRLPKEAMDWVAPLLQSMGWMIENVEDPGRFRSPNRYYTVIRKNSGQRILFCVSAQILNDEANHEHLSNVITVLAHVLKNNRLIIFSDGLKDVHIVYSTYVARTWKQNFGIVASFISGRNLEDLKSLSEKEQKDILQDVLNLDELLQPYTSTSSLSITDMLLQDIRHIKELIASLNDFLDARGRKGLVSGAGLEKILSNFNYEGPPRTVAGTLVDTLMEYGPMPEDDLHLSGPIGRQALGELLCYIVLTIHDTPQHEVQFLQSIIKKYNLMPSGTCKSIS